MIAVPALPLNRLHAGFFALIYTGHKKIPLCKGDFQVPDLCMLPHHPCVNHAAPSLKTMGFLHRQVIRCHPFSVFL